MSYTGLIALVLLAALAECAPVEQAPTKQIDAVCLIERNGINRLLQKVQPHGVLSHPAAMSGHEHSIKVSAIVNKDHCGMLCAADPTCRSYSVRLGDDGHQVKECVLSKIAPSTQQQFKALASAYGSKTRVDIDGTTIEVESNPKCTLYILDHLDYYHQIDNDSELAIAGKLLLPVANKNKCAEYCMQRNFDAHWIRLNQFAASIGGARIGQLGVFETRSDDLVRCDQFEYLPASGLNYLNVDSISRFANHSVEVEEIVDKSIMSFVSLGPDARVRKDGGYCIVSHRSASQRLKPYIKLLEQSVDSEVYRFNFDHFYYKVDSTRLLDSPKDSETVRKLHYLAHGNTYDLDAQKVAFESLAKGDNNQEKLGAQDCALLCSGNDVHPWPGCRSFDLVTENVAEGGVESSCLGNSITLEQARAMNRNDLIEASAGPAEDKSSEKTVKVVHYEPFMGLHSKLVALDWSTFGSSC